MKTIDEVKKIVEESNNIVFLGGAGVSTESGIPDFRSATGLYNKTQGTSYSPECILSRSYYKEDPEGFLTYVKENLIYPEAKPNLAHKALAYLEKEGKLRALITQNIDGLHQKAGSQKLIEIHGTLEDFYCDKCNKSYSQEEVLSGDLVKCDCGGYIRPDIVMYEEALDMGRQMEAIQAISSCDMLIVGGTSLVVYPVAGYLDFYKGSKLVLINKHKTPRDSMADYVIHEGLGKTMAYISGMED